MSLPTRIGFGRLTVQSNSYRLMHDINVEIGYSGILIAFLFSLFGIIVLARSIYRQVKTSNLSDQVALKNRSLPVIYAVGVLAGALVATGALEHGLITHDFSLVYVEQNNSLQTPLLYTITGMWSSLSGSILLWGLVLAIYIACASWYLSRRNNTLIAAWVILVGLVVSLFFFGLMLGPSNPFLTLTHPPVNGLGPNPLLQDYPLVAFHPPLLYAGLVGFTIPFGFAIAGLATGDIGVEWSRDVRRWTLVAWGCLGTGILLGAWWSYQVLGWGGFWGWDPVENAAFVPWLVATAFLHSVIAHNRRGIYKMWNVSLICSTFALTILCTFLTRSGVLESVHAFSNSDIGPYLIAFFGLSVVTSVVLIVWRTDRLRSPSQIDAPLSREGLFLANNFAFGALGLVILLGTIFPLFVEAVTSKQVTVGSPYFNEMTMPIIVTLLILMGIAPVLPWRTATTELAMSRLTIPLTCGTVILLVCVGFGVRGLGPLIVYFLAGFGATSAIRQLAIEIRRRGITGLLGRSGGGMIVHLGVLVVACAMASSLSFGHRAEFAMRPNESVSYFGHRIEYMGVQDVKYPNRAAIEAKILVDNSRILKPALSQYQGGGPSVGTPAVDSSVTNDLYLTIDMTPANANGVAEIGVVVQSMVEWIWIGGAIVALGTLMALLDPTVLRSKRKLALSIGRSEDER